MLYAFAVARFAKKARDRGAILAQLFAQHLHGDGAVIGVVRAENGGCSAFTDFALQRISGDRLSDEILAWHAANLISPPSVASERSERVSSSDSNRTVSCDATRDFAALTPAQCA